MWLRPPFQIAPPDHDRYLWPAMLPKINKLLHELHVRLTEDPAAWAVRFGPESGFVAEYNNLDTHDAQTSYERVRGGYSQVITANNSSAKGS
jgi:hypothetical protein